ncbi:mannose-6-phosphate isomerase, class I [Glutamicibacter uratoxydans]|uniref:mannose-6-phosphate isomerase n=1 Tax=Glutamicibacter uratoxydans TaxID=43667 RepID=A0A4Y4DT49_GLUUR|nr:mannose-6-phosphate isomerase, class I [Glutamicibacter uratoxydans]GED06775.1 mannose-6-phosphate isomerase, class I [Glutamicibacter uratoxydans]
MFELNNTIRDYHWGSENQITELLGLEESISPQAEMWLGAHPGCPSRTVQGAGLDQVIAEDPQRILGADIAQRYGSLPFLVKVLSAAQPLSIQVHPTLEQAKSRFAKENASGKPLDAADRNYKDANHKPEMLYALTDFAALSGFREPAAIINDLAALQPHVNADSAAVLAQLVEVLQGPDPLAQALEFVLGSDQDIAAVVTDLCAAIAADAGLCAQVQLAELVRINQVYPGDCGVLVALLLNLVFLRPGQAISLAAGNVHAYLRGLGIEVMANSDNVLRGGLTSKHIDVAELLDVTIAQPAPAPLLEPVGAAENSSLYQPDFDEFQLQVIDCPQAQEPVTLQLHGASVLLCTAGSFTVRTAQAEKTLTRGQSVLVGADELPASAAALEAGTLFAASAQER